MPHYDYHCSTCGHEAEVFQKISEDALRICPSCGKETFERLVSKSSFALRGSGWYADGYGAKPSSGADSAKAGAEPKAAEPKAAEPRAAEPKPKTAKSDD